MRNLPTNIHAVPPSQAAEMQADEPDDQDDFIFARLAGLRARGVPVDAMAVAEACAAAGKSSDQFDDAVDSEIDRLNNEYLVDDGEGGDE